MNDLYLVMPAYNEENNIKEVIESWYPVLDGKGENSRLVVADSGSTDTTHSVLNRLREKYPKLEILSNTAKEHGPKVIALYDYAIRSGADYIFQTDSDGQTNPREFEMFWNMRDQYDAILGNRRVRGDGKIRAYVERVVCFLIYLFYGIQVPDANAPFRLFRADLVKRYLYRMPFRHNLPNIMLTVYFKHYGERIEFKEITFGKRKGGVNSINIFKIIGIGWHALGDFSVLRREFELEEVVNLDRRKNEMILTGIAFALFFFTACYKLTNASLWSDETIEYWFSKIVFGKIPFGDSVNMYERIIATYQPPLYNVLMHFWLKVSDAEWWFRFFGVIMGFIAMLGLYKSVRKLSNALVAAVSVIFASFVVQLVYYWQECAEYCLMLGGLCWTIYFWICLMQEVNRRNIILFTIAAVIPIYSQYGAVFPVASMALLALGHVIMEKNKEGIIAMGVSYFCALAGAAVPLYYFFLRKQMPNGGGIKSDNWSWEIIIQFFKGIYSIFRWNFEGCYSEISIKIFLLFFMIIIILSITLRKKNKWVRQVALVNFITYLLYYIAVKSGLYAYGDFGKRYSLFFIPMWIVLGFMSYNEILQYWSEKGKQGMLLIFDTKNVFIGITAFSLICFCIFNWTQVLQKNWVKEDIRGAVSEWFSEGGPEIETLIYSESSSGFSYYIRQNEWYSEWMEQKVHYMDSLRGKGAEECERCIDEIYESEWPLELYFVASHLDTDFDMIMECFISKGYLAEYKFNLNGGRLVYLKQQ